MEELTTIQAKLTDPGIEITVGGTNITVKGTDKDLEFDQVELPVPVTIGQIKELICYTEGISADKQRLYHLRGREPLGDDVTVGAGTVLKLVECVIRIQMGKELYEYQGVSVEARDVQRWLAQQVGCLVGDLTLRRGRVVLHDDDFLVGGETLRATRRYG